MNTIGVYETLARLQKFGSQEYQRDYGGYND